MKVAETELWGIIRFCNQTADAFQGGESRNARNYGCWNRCSLHFRPSVNFTWWVAVVTDVEHSSGGWRPRGDTGMTAHLRTSVKDRSIPVRTGVDWYRHRHRITSTRLQFHYHNQSIFAISFIKKCKKYTRIQCTIHPALPFHYYIQYLEHGKWIIIRNENGIFAVVTVSWFSIQRCRIESKWKWDEMNKSSIASFEQINHSWPHTIQVQFIQRCRIYNKPNHPVLPYLQFKWINPALSVLK